MQVLSFGSLNLDYVYQVDHFVQKGETLASTGLQVFCGGKGLNQSLALQKAGVTVRHAGVIGPDGQILLDMLEKAGVDCSLVQRVKEPRSGNAIIQCDRQGDNCIMLYGGANQVVDEAMVDEILNEFVPGDYLLVQNEISSLPYLVRRAHERGMYIVLNPSPIDEGLFQLDFSMIDLIILNEIEGKALTGCAGDIEELLERLCGVFPCAEIVLTLGEDGSIYHGKEGTIREKGCRVRQVVDTTAAGDTFTGYYLAERIRGRSAAEALRTASCASAIAVTRKGASVSIPELDEVQKFTSDLQESR